MTLPETLSMASCRILTMVDGVRVAVPDAMDQITTYVLYEQEDWFEDEIKFLRRILKPGQQIIDIGANCGVYALSMARTVGPKGRVWAFEPASATADLLAQGIAANGFENVVLERCAVSAAAGVAHLSVGALPEMNAVSHDAAAGGEAVTLVSLDDCIGTRSWRDIAFLKIDAEGEEQNILTGGRRFFTEFSPLVQYELVRDGVIQVEVIDAFTALGYDCYRLVPGLGVLVPFSQESAPDRFQLNLFACKPDRAAELAAEGFLVDRKTLAESQEWFQDVGGQSSIVENYSWRRTLATRPYAAPFVATWETTMMADRNESIDEGLAFHAFSRDPNIHVADRYVALTVSMYMFKNVCDADPSRLRLSSLARSARECGMRTAAIHAFMQLSKTILEEQSADPSEPFLAPSERFEAIPPGDAPGNWILAGVLEELERINTWSSYYNGSLDRLQLISNLGFASPEMLRRLALVEARYDPTAP